MMYLSRIDKGLCSSATEMIKDNGVVALNGPHRLV